MTLVCEDGNSKLVEVVAVVDVDDEKCVGNILLQILKLTLKKLIFCSEFEHKVWSIFRNSGKILKLGQDFEV